MREKIKIAYLDYSHIFAGAERVLYTIISHLDRSRFEPVLVFPYPMEHQAGYAGLDCPKHYLADGLKWWMGSDRWRHPLRGTDLLARSIWGCRLARLLKKERVDILHVNLLRPDALMWILPAKLSGIKVIGHFRSQSLEWIPPRSVQRQCDLILCVSQYSRNRMLLKGEHAKSMVLYDSVNVDVFKPAVPKTDAKRKLGFPEDCFLMSSIGQLSRHKGHDNAIRAFMKIADTYPKALLFIAGGGRHEDLEYLKQIVGQYPATLQGRVIFSGEQVANITEVYSATDLVLSLTKVGEAFGLVPYEAALMDCPFIAPDKGAVKEFITTGVNGILVETEDVDAIAEAMRYIMDNQQKAAEMIARTAQMVLEKLTPAVMIRNLENVYDRIVE